MFLGQSNFELLIWIILLDVFLGKVFKINERKEFESFNEITPGEFACFKVNE